MAHPGDTWPIQKLREWDKNPRTITKEAFERLKWQIEHLKEYKPLLINQDGIVLGGNMRLKAYREMGKKDVWVSVVETKSEEEMWEYALSDNDHVGATDQDMLANEMPNLDIDWSKYAVDLKEPTNLGDLLDQFKEVVEDEVPEVSNEPAVSKLGEVYQLGRHRLMCGDATKIEDVTTLMDGKNATMVFTDPPYNVNYTGGMGTHEQNKREGILNDKMSSDQFYRFLNSVMSNLVTVTQGAFYVCMSSSELHNLWRAFTDAGGHWQTYIIWAKDHFTLSRSDYQHQFEPIMYGLTAEEQQKMQEETDEESLPIMYGWTKHYWYGGRKQGDVWHFDKPNKSADHPTMKPVALCAKAIKNSSRKGEIVLDTFGGSGSTLMACQQLDRVCYMSELDPHYCDVIRKRYAKFIGKEAQWEKETPAL